MALTSAAHRVLSPCRQLVLSLDPLLQDASHGWEPPSNISISCWTFNLTRSILMQLLQRLQIRLSKTTIQNALTPNTCRRSHSRRPDLHAIALLRLQRSRFNQSHKHNFRNGALLVQTRQLEYPCRLLLPCSTLPTSRHPPTVGNSMANLQPNLSLPCLNIGELGVPLLAGSPSIGHSHT